MDANYRHQHYTRKDHQQQAAAHLPESCEGASLHAGLWAHRQHGQAGQRLHAHTAPVSTSTLIRPQNTLKTYLSSSLIMIFLEYWKRKSLKNLFLDDSVEQMHETWKIIHLYHVFIDFYYSSKTNKCDKGLSSKT